MGVSSVQRRYNVGASEATMVGRGASLSRSQDRAGWTVIFRHPAVFDVGRNRLGKRVRYGLGTRDDDQAARLVEQINELLADERWWSATARPAASGRFDPRVVEIFYDKLE